jgi:hypothetical protein
MNPNGSTEIQPTRHANKKVGAVVLFRFSLDIHPALAKNAGNFSVNGSS